MPAQEKPRTPAHVLHKANDQAVVRLSGRDVYLGPLGSLAKGRGLLGSSLGRREDARQAQTTAARGGPGSKRSSVRSEYARLGDAEDPADTERPQAVAWHVGYQVERGYEHGSAVENATAAEVGRDRAVRRNLGCRHYQCVVASLLESPRWTARQLERGSRAFQS